MKPHKSIYDNYKTLADEELVYRYVQRNEYAAVYHLFERYGHLVFGICMGYMAESAAATKATQEVFVYLLTDLKRYTINTFKPWLYNYTKNYCAFHTEGGAEVVNNKIGKGDDEAFSKGPQIESEADLNHLVTVLAQVEPDRRHCLELFYSKKMNYKEIVAKTGLTYAEVESLVRSGKTELKNKLQASGT